MAKVDLQEAETSSKWHVGKEIPIAMMFTIAVQTAGIVWWASGINSRVESLERQVSAAAWQAEKIIRIDEKLANVQSSIAEVKDIIKDYTSNRRDNRTP